MSIIAEEEIALAMDSPAHPIEELGITRLSKSWQCGHVFCRKDISKWILEAHDSCPMCRHLLVERTPDVAPSEPDPNPDSPLRSLEQQLELHSGLLRSLNMLGSVPVSQARDVSLREADVQADEDRNQFSGMYS
ncbi:hypothetical protein DXG01_006285 [Tephrocybe rancida]|nr:hypothetical protein DXG01_006285 [Tephrocybe rancida]